MGRVPVEGWITYDKGNELCRMAGLDLAELKKDALGKDFKPVTLPGAMASFKVDEYPAQNRFAQCRRQTRRQRSALKDST